MKQVEDLKKRVGHDKAIQQQRDENVTEWRFWELNLPLKSRISTNKHNSVASMQKKKKHLQKLFFCDKKIYNSSFKTFSNNKS
jgi:hypothetical protein